MEPGFYFYKDKQHARNVVLVTTVGTKYIHYVMITNKGVRLKKMNLKEGRYLIEPTMAYESTNVAVSFLKSGERIGITKEARDALESFIKGSLVETQGPKTTTPNKGEEQA